MVRITRANSRLVMGLIVMDVGGVALTWFPRLEFQSRDVFTFNSLTVNELCYCNYGKPSTVRSS